MKKCKIKSNSKINHSIIADNSEIVENLKTSINDHGERTFLLGEGSKISL